MIIVMYKEGAIIAIIYYKISSLIKKYLQCKSKGRYTMGKISLLGKVAFTIVLRCEWENKNYHGVLPHILGKKVWIFRPEEKI